MNHPKDAMGIEVKLGTEGGPENAKPSLAIIPSETPPVPLFNDITIQDVAGIGSIYRVMHGYLLTQGGVSRVALSIGKRFSRLGKETTVWECRIHTPGPDYKLFEEIKKEEVHG